MIGKREKLKIYEKNEMTILLRYNPV